MTDFNLFAKAIDDRSKAREDYLRHLSIVFSGIFGILISLHHPPAGSWLHHYFSATLCVIALGILLASIALYQGVVARQRLYELLKEELIASLASGEKPKPVTYNPPTFFEWCEYAAYLLLALAMVMLMLYAFLR